MTRQGDDAEIENRVLSGLSAAALKQILPYMKRVELRRRHVIYRTDEPIDKIYFVNRGLISMIATMKDGRTVEINAVGIEGAVGIHALFGIPTATLECIVQLSGSAICFDSRYLNAEVAKNPIFENLLQRYRQLAIRQIAQTAACNRLHTLEQRCCRWLLIAHDSAGSDQFELTHEFLAMMLGVRREGVSLAANSLQQSGLIRYMRGRVTIGDRRGLETCACECYGTIRHLTNRLFGKPSKLMGS